MSTPFPDLQTGLTEIENAITNAIVAGSITPEIHGAVLSRVLSTVFEVIPELPGVVSMRAGTGLPAAGLGVVGDHYVQLENGNVHQKTAPTVWTLTGVSLRGTNGTNGTNGSIGPAGPAGPSIALRENNGVIQWKLSTQADSAFVDLYDVADFVPVLAVNNDRELTFRTAGEDVATASVLYDFTDLVPEFRVNSTNLQWKLQVQADVNYQTVLDLQTITPVFRVDSGNLQVKYATEDDTAYETLTALTATSVVDGDQVVIDIPVPNITPDITQPQSTNVKHLGAILRGISNKLTNAPLQLRTGQFSALEVSNLQKAFNVALTTPAEAMVFINGVWMNPSWYTLAANGVLSWPNGGDFASAAVAGARVSLISH